ncbi:nitrogenase molybdenum-iron protein beta chain [Ruminiclostridium sufflavum DSM 19573]|uniref:Nitrogenase molybdenum-iron protein beta chain n=1 Tax=Ruminiclostridium sufflavum DSM 19573 TaxID=1121337 RepID=A0A318XJH9_9FIRM|nr:nitrogenase component 1 [Ruminiclostridium sufflavum]PYG87374.1 nitrogenase molybdenum-iron protein beta chain [Ruminiclostridium sufflavum DSM 19573]
MAERNLKVTGGNNTIVHPHYACAIGGAYSAVAIKGGVPIANCGPGCMYKQYFFMGFENGFQGSTGAGGGNVPSANVGESDIVFGGMKKLDDLIKATLAIYDADLFVVATGCTGELVGDDVGSVVKKYREAGYPVVYADTGGFKGSNLIGHEIVVKAIIDQFVGDYDGKRQKGLVNLWFETPYFNTNWRGDYIEIVRILRAIGFKVNVLFGPQSEGVSEWRDIPKAQFNLIISPWAGIEIVRHLEKKYNQPYLHIPVIPIGEEATSAFIRELVKYAEIDEEESEKFIKEEAELYYYFLDSFSHFFAEYWYGLPSRFAVVGDSAYTLAYTKFLADQVGLIPVKQIITDNPPEQFREEIREEFRKLSEGVSVEIEFMEDGYLAEKALAETDFGSGVPLILGSTWESDVAREKNALLLEIDPPSSETVVLNRSHIGYRGALQLLERIYTATVGSK